MNNYIRIYSESNIVRIEAKTDRLLINSYSEKDFKNCVTLYENEKLVKYFDHGKPRSREEVRILIIERSLNFLNNNIPFGLFSVFDKLDNKFLGQADLIPTNIPGEVELGCILHREYHNQGYAFEICKFLIVDYIEHLNQKHLSQIKYFISKVIATAHPKNYASQRLIKHLGMTFDKSQERFGQPRLWYSYAPSFQNYEHIECHGK